MDRLVGDWEQFERDLEEIGNRAEPALQSMVDDIGYMLEDGMRERIEEGDDDWEELDEEYKRRKAREGYSTQILIREGHLLAAIHYERRGKCKGFAGVTRRAARSESNPKKSLVDLALIHELGYEEGGIPARPFIDPTLKAKEEGIDARVDEAMEEIAGDAGR